MVVWAQPETSVWRKVALLRSKSVAVVPVVTVATVPEFSVSVSVSGLVVAVATTGLGVVSTPDDEESQSNGQHHGSEQPVTRSVEPRVRMVR